MTIHKFAIADAPLERSPGQDGDIFVGNVLDQRHGGPVTIGFGRYGPAQTLKETMDVHDTMVILRGKDYCFRRLRIGDGRSGRDHRHAGGRGRGMSRPYPGGPSTPFASFK